MMLRGYASAGIARRVEVYKNPHLEDGVGVYDPPTLHSLAESVPLVLAGVAGAPEQHYPSIPVVDILRDSIGEDIA